MLQRLFRTLTLLCLVLPAAALAQERFSIFVGSDPTNVERMIRLAELREGDRVIDLGSGDGRIVIAAALAHPKVTGMGVDIDPKLVAEATAAAEKAGVDPRVRFLRQNVFDAELSDVSVIFMWLWPEMQTMLRPKIFAEARPGTRVVTNVWDLGNWQPDRVDNDGPQISLWVVPARLQGYWTWNLDLPGKPRAYAAVLEQHFQKAEGFVRVGNRRAILREVKLSGADVRILVDMTIDGAGFGRHEFVGKVNGDTIEGEARIMLRPAPNKGDEERIVLPWRARRTSQSAYFAPTGLDAP
jgi:precorrin-6B methylase 2